MRLELYLHFPFCKSKCSYCDFCSFSAPMEEVENYGMLLQKEMRLAAKPYGEAQISTVFLGGGTPSVLPPKTLGGVLSTLTTCFSLTGDVEFSAEANPGTLTEEWLSVAQSYGVNRLSLGVQAAQDRLLKALGRIHSFEEARQSVEMIRRQGIHNVNVDVMFGLPGQSVRDYLETLEAAHTLAPTHISAYGLILEEGTKISAMVEKGALTLPDEDMAAEMYEQGAGWLSAHGYAQYEISNFAREGYACRHNLGYWQGEWYLGLGLNSHSMLPEAVGADASYVRVENTADLAVYQAMLQSGKLPVQGRVPVSPSEAMFETVMLELRTTAGIGIRDFERRHGKPLQSVYGRPMEQLIGEGLALWHEDPARGRSFALTKKGLLVQNAVLMRFMET